MFLDDNGGRFDRVSLVSQCVQEFLTMKVSSRHQTSVGRIVMLLLVVGLLPRLPGFADEKSVRPPQVPESAIEVTGLRIADATCWADDNLLYIVLQSLPKDSIVSIPRLANSIRTVTWQDTPKESLTVKPEPQHWLIELDSTANVKATVIILQLDGPLTLMSTDLIDGPNSQGIIRLPASHAITHGSTLRFEPQPHKNTVGYWSNDKDYAEWKFQVPAPGRFEVDVLQGCGKGHGGSEVQFKIGPQSLPMIVQETGHFQNFVWRTVGVAEFSETGLQSLQIVPVQKVAGAVMDVREVRLVPAGTDRSFDSQLVAPEAFQTLKPLNKSGPARK
jgi:hypothetical protein